MALPLVLSVLYVSSTWGATFHWTGSAGNNLFNDAGNWNPSTAAPGATDSAYINAAQSTDQIMVDKATTVQELFLTAGLLYVPNALTASTTLAVTADGTLKLDCGAQEVTSPNANITAPAGLQFASGVLAGSWDIGASSVLNFTGAGQKAFMAANLTSRALTLLDGGATFNLNASAVNFAKSLSLTAPLSQPAVFMGTADSVLSGGLTINGNSRANLQVPTNLDTVQVGAGGYLAIIQGKQAISSLIATSGSTVEFLGGTSGTIATLSCAGKFNSAGTVTVTSSASLNTLEVTNGETTFMKTATAANVQMSGGTLVGSGFTATSFSISQVGELGGTGQFSVGSFTSGSQQTTIRGPTLAIVETASLRGTLVFASGANSGMGKLNISSTAKATSAGASFILQGTKPTGSVLGVDGVFSVSGEVTVQQLNAGGSGALELTAGGDLAVQSGAWAAKSASLAPGTTVHGDQSLWAFDTVTGTTDITLTIDAVVVDCGKQCPPVHSTKPEVSFSLVAAAQ